MKGIFTILNYYFSPGRRAAQWPLATAPAAVGDRNLHFAQYMSEKNKRVYALLGILGERKEGILFLLIIERGTLVLTSMCVASVIHFFIRNTLHRILNLPDCKMIFNDYVIVALLCFLASLIAAIPYAVSYLFKQYTVQLKQSE